MSKSRRKRGPQWRPRIDLANPPRHLVRPKRLARHRHAGDEGENHHVEVGQDIEDIRANAGFRGGFRVRDLVRAIDREELRRAAGEAHDVLRPVRLDEKVLVGQASRERRNRDVLPSPELNALDYLIDHQDNTRLEPGS
jgi:hypothetical protein